MPDAYDDEEIALKKKKIYDAIHKLVKAVEAAHCPDVEGFALIPANYLKIVTSVLFALGAADAKTNDEIVDCIEEVLNILDIRHGGVEMMPGEHVQLMWLPEMR